MRNNINDIKKKMKTVTTAGFYVTGGTVPRDSPSYVVRQADQQLLDALQAHQFCYVLTSRQMGKSSLMVRTVARLRQEGTTCVVLDLTSIGQNLSEEQWYDGLLNRTAIQLDMEDELDAFWAKLDRLGPLQRWVQALEQVVLASIPGQIVLFVDEIDAVRSLPFSTDEFFAAIRSCYNRRTEDISFERLTFCLLGVATPADLIQDIRSTPFNIGTRIELQDFTQEEAGMLASGLEENRALGVEALGVGRSETGTPVSNLSTPNTHEYPIPTKPLNAQRPTPNAFLMPNAFLVPNAQRLLSRVLYWTGGHPYLTQRLCAAVAAHMTSETNASPDAIVDSTCAELFLSPAARHRDDNLLFVRECLLRSDTDRAALLETYASIRSGRRLKDDETDLRISLLHLSGIIRTDRHYLTVRNRIYSHTFDRHWIRANMPDAELRRQKMAFQQGFVRATALGLGIVSLTGWLAFTAIQKSREAHLQAKRADAATIRALQEADTSRRNLYAADMALAQQAWKDKDLRRVRFLLDSYQFVQGQPDLRGFEWWLLWTRGHFDMPIIHSSTTSLAYCKDGSYIRTMDDKGMPRLWASNNGEWSPGQGVTEFLTTGNSAATDTYHNGLVLRSTNREYQAEGTHYVSEEKQELAHTSVTLRNLKTHQTYQLKGAMGPFAFSPDSKILATESNTDDIYLYDTASGKQVGSLYGARGPMAFSPDSDRLAAESYAYGWVTKVFDVRHNREPHALSGTSDPVSVAPFPNRVATVDSDWNGVTIRLEHNEQVACHISGATTPVAISPDGRTLAAGVRHEGGKVGLWDARTGKRLHTLKLDSYEANSVVFSGNRKLLATHAFNGGITLWDVSSGKALKSFHGTGTPAFSPNGNWIAFEEAPTSRSKGRLAIYDLSNYSLIHTIPDVGDPVAFSPQEPLIALTDQNGSIQLWDTVHWKLRPSHFSGHRYPLHTMIFSPDGTRIVAGDSGEYNVIFWDVATGRETFRIPGRTDRTDVASYGMGFTQDGMRFYCGNQDGVTKVWGYH